MKPRLTTEMNEISLDHITLLVEYIQRVFSDVYEDDESTAEDWDVVRIREEMASIFEPRVFHNLFSNDFGKGVIIGSWIDRFIVNADELTEEEDDNGYTY